VRIIEQSFEYIEPVDGVAMCKLIEKAGRECWKSGDKITEDSYKDFIRMILQAGHLSVIEHCKITVKVTTSRDISHQLVRHRISSYSQTSQRYVNYAKKGLEFVLPLAFANIKISNNNSAIAASDYSDDNQREAFKAWLLALQVAERSYNRMIELGLKPQTARSVLPNAAATTIVITNNLRQWRHFFEERCSTAAQPEMQELAKAILKSFALGVPIIFDDLYKRYPSEKI